MNSVLDKYKDANGFIDFCKLSDEEIEQYVKEKNMEDGFYRFIVRTEPYIKYVHLLFFVFFSIFTSILGWMAFKLLPISMSGGLTTFGCMAVCIALATVFKKKSGY